MKTIRLWAIYLLLIPISFTGMAKDREGNPDNRHTTHILILGLKDNVKSNYFYKEAIAEATGVKADSIDREYNNIISENIAAAFPASGFKFKQANSALYELMAEKVAVQGEGENCSSDLSGISAEELQQALDKTGTEYLLVLNRHYLKWQEEPMRTIFHIISYTLFDKNRKAILKGSQFFTCINLESSDRIQQISRKSTSKIAAAVFKSLDRE
jgi:hypothetical protein